MTPLSPIAPTATHAAEATRPRMEGKREQEVLQATLGRAGRTRVRPPHHGRRRHHGEGQQGHALPSLVDEAGPRGGRRLISQKYKSGPVPDTGSLRGDLLETFCGGGGFTDASGVAMFASVLTAISRDEEFAEIFRQRSSLPRPPLAAWSSSGPRLVARSARASTSTCWPGPRRHRLHRLFLMGLPPDKDIIRQVVDQIILPAALAPTWRHSTPRELGNPHVQEPMTDDAPTRDESPAQPKGHRAGLASSSSRSPS